MPQLVASPADQVALAEYDEGAGNDLSPTVAETLATSAMDTHAATAEPVRVKLLKARLPRERRTNNRSSAPPRTALNGSIPNGPIAVAPRALAPVPAAHAIVGAKPASQAGGSLEDLMAEVARRTSSLAVSM